MKNIMVIEEYTTLWYIQTVFIRIYKLMVVIYEYLLRWGGTHPFLWNKKCYDII